MSRAYVMAVLCCGLVDITLLRERLMAMLR